MNLGHVLIRWGRRFRMCPGGFRAWRRPHLMRAAVLFVAEASVGVRPASRPHDSLSHDSLSNALTDP
eukprot:4212664-Pyramimonas_sp.AAC.1